MSTGKRGGFRPGAGRKPGSRNRATVVHKAGLSDIAREHTNAAIATLVAVMGADGETGSARVAAANAILDRAYGKPRQAVEHSGAIGSYDLSRLSDDELEHLDAIMGRLGGADAGTLVDHSGETSPESPPALSA